MEIKLASHEHSMEYHNFHEIDDKWCGKCSQKICGAAYACLKCERWLHQSCAKALEHLPREITHPLHPRHHLILDWSATWGFTCDKCLKISSGTNYCCCRCDFELDLACAFATDDDDQQAMKKKKRSNYEQIIQHYCHIHPLVLNKYGNNTDLEHDYDCSWCDKPLAGIFYGCKGCEFFLHEICTNKIPKTLNHPFHPPHPLRLQFVNSQTNCNACTQIIQQRTGSTSSYCCQKCNFNLDFYCAKMLPTLKHECHSHYLTYFGLNYFRHKKIFRFHLECNACHELCSDSLYRCVQCNFNLHLQCVPVPPLAKHKYHRHPLVLKSSVREDDVGEYYCDICEEERNPTQEVYYCEKCKFIAHIECVLNEDETSPEKGSYSTSTRQSMEGKALVPKEIEQIEMMDENYKDHLQLLFQPRIHQHPLKFYEAIESFEQPYCRACRLEVDGPCYICDVCKPSVIHGIYLHENCAKLPNDIHHPLHPQHRLNLYATPPYMLDFIICDECEEVSFGVFYFCEECDFKLDLNCATRAPPRIGSSTTTSKESSERESELFHFSDKHKLIFCNFGDPTYKRQCNFCRLPILGPTYNCLRCGWILHESCVRLPQEMQVPIHPQHVSVLSYFRDGRCHACELKLLSAGYNYGCQECDLSFHITCANSLGRALKPDQSHSHMHDLYYFGTDFIRFFAMYCDFIDIFAGSFCSRCCQNCSGQPFYRCLECRINFHLECVPIPQVVKSKTHIHPFTLKDSFREDDDSENSCCYCDVCEEERRPNDHVYFCEECCGLFVAHIECVLIKEEQVLSYLVPRERKRRMR